MPSLRQALADERARGAATSEILRAVGASLGDPQPVIDLIARKAAALYGAASCVVWRVEGGTFTCRAAQGSDPEPSMELRATPPGRLADDALTGRVVMTGGAVREDDAADKPRGDRAIARRGAVRRRVGVLILVGGEV